MTVQPGRWAVTPQPDNWTLRRRVVRLLAVVSVLLGALVAAEITVAAQNREHTHAVLDRTGPLRDQSQELLNVLVDQETAIRGYALTGDQRELEPYTQGSAREQALYRSMGGLISAYPALVPKLDTVRAQAAQWRATVAEPVIRTTAEDGTGAGRALITDETAKRFEAIRGSLADLQEGILDERDKGAAAIYRTSTLLVVLLIVAALVVVVAGGVLLVSLDRIVVRPLTRLAEQVREVAEGDYQHRITGAGPPELQQLAGDVDAMRQKIAKDLTEVREARESIEWVNGQLQKQAEELTRSNRDLEQFAYVASHDLQEPLRKVASFCQLLQRRYAGRLDERADQYIAFAVDGAQRMQRLINDLLAFSRIGRLTTGFTEVDLNRVMGDVAGQTESARQYADAELTWDELPVIRGEEPLLTNLLANLVSNSVKFRRADVPPRVHVSARLVGDEWEISCRDNGIGIEPEFADKIFVIFQRLHSKDAYPGTGIGLAIAKKIVEYHDGRVWVDTETIEGTTIRFTLPALPEDVEAAEAAARAAEEAADHEPGDGTEPTGDGATGAEPPRQAGPGRRRGPTGPRTATARVT
ncbi:sensor histidine kinase [Micromonospora olivasterospora]|uniref:histidine kinase n=1 Tax=Micromonospora olivasterospora TaxID=1880 RepID=A0A562I6R4_MICOL|nr:sensor histidine kinase [Micromonospora olivasterospora]TWH66720.1 multi-sensor signal transduction histidine kinase [Micromonospora olivasterospora]